MPEINWTAALEACTCEVLETMFFTSPTGYTAPDAPPESTLRASLLFSGDLCGSFSVAVSEGAARLLAAGFIGLEENELSEEKAGEVICELANMICGAVLSHVKKHGRFQLLHPELGDRACACRPADNAVVSRSLDLGNGVLTACLMFHNSHD